MVWIVAFGLKWDQQNETVLVITSIAMKLTCPYVADKSGQISVFCKIHRID